MPEQILPQNAPTGTAAIPHSCNPEGWRCWAQGWAHSNASPAALLGIPAAVLPPGRDSQSHPGVSTHVSVSWHAAAHGWRSKGSCKSTGGKTKRQLVSVPQEGRVLWKYFQPEPLGVCLSLPNSKWTRFIQVSIENVTCNKSKVKCLQFSIIIEQGDAENEPKQNLQASGIASPET